MEDREYEERARVAALDRAEGMDEFDLEHQRIRMDSYQDWRAYCPRCQKTFHGTVTQLMEHGSECVAVMGH